MSFSSFFGKISPTIIIISMVLFLLSWIYVIFYGAKLNNYIQKYKKDRWKFLLKKSTRKNKPKYEFFWKWLAYVRNDKDTEDKNIKFYKKKIMFGFKWWLTVICSLLAYLILGTIIIMIESGHLTI